MTAFELWEFAKGIIGWWLWIAVPSSVFFALFMCFVARCRKEKGR